MNKNTIQSKPSGIFFKFKKRISLFDLDTKSFSKIIKNIKAIVKNFIIIEKIIKFFNESSEYIKSINEGRDKDKLKKMKLKKLKNLNIRFP